MKRRVVITGMGAITPVGLNVDDFWNNIKAGKVGIGEITKMDVKDYKVKLAAEVKNFDAKDYMDAKTARRMELFCQYAVAAAGEAINDSGLVIDNEDAYMCGTSIGSAIGSLQAIEREYNNLTNKGPNRINPMLVPLMFSNMAAGNVAIAYGLKGKSINCSTSCAAGTNSIGEAYRSILCGDADIMVSGGAEACISPLGIGSFMALTALSTCTDAIRASIPFDKDRSGFVMGEGAGILILEELEHAKRRGAKIYAEIAGYGCSNDAFHITTPLSDGSGVAHAMTNAMREADVLPCNVDYINAHGTGTRYNDLYETRAIKLAFGDAAENIKISSTKSMIGHLLGAAGAVELIACVKSVSDSYVHHNAGLRQTEEEMDLDYVKDKAIEMEVNCCISNSLGFGGHNASILIKKYQA